MVISGEVSTLLAMVENGLKQRKALLLKCVLTLQEDAAAGSDMTVSHLNQRFNKPRKWSPHQDSAGFWYMHHIAVQV